MTESAARLVDKVMPRVPVPQWVPSVPYRLRYLLAWDQALARAVLAVHVRVLSSGTLQSRPGGTEHGSSWSYWRTA
jgi:hypothetical protein